MSAKEIFELLFCLLKEWRSETVRSACPESFAANNKPLFHPLSCHPANPYLTPLC